MAEPLEVLLAKIRRPRPRQQYQPLEQVGGDSPGMRGSINPLDSQAISDRAQGVDISSVDPPTRLLSSRMDDDMYAGQTPTNLASTDDEAPNPFQTAAGSNARQGQARPTQMQYRTECGPNGCRRVPILDAAPSAQIQQLSPQAMPQQLPEGVTLGPGETLVPGSVRQGGPSSSPSTSMVPRMQVPPALQSVPASVGAPSREPVPSYLNPQQFYDRAEDYYRQADSALASRNAIGTVQNNNRANLHMQAGMTAAALSEARRMNDIKQENFLLARKDKQEADRRRTPKGQAELEIEVISMPGQSVEYRADQLLQLRQAARTQAQMVYTQPQLDAERAMLEGAITASDAVRNQVRYQTLVDGSPDKKAMIKTAHASLYDGLMSRYGKIADKGARSDAMSRELLPAYTQEFTEYYRQRPQLLGSGATEDAINAAANDMAINRVQTNIARVNDMVESGRSPWASLTYDELMQAAKQQQQQAAPAKDADPGDDDSGAGEKQWTPPMSTMQFR